jgi:hypothetical protein
MPFGVAKHQDRQVAEEVIHQRSAVQLDLSRLSRNGVAGQPQSGLGRIVGNLSDNRAPGSRIRLDANAIIDG